MSHIVTVSPKGQITIPVGERKFSPHRKYLLDRSNQTFILRPIEIKVIEEELSDFSALATSSFDFWEDEADDVYQDFYSHEKV